ncbi:MAG: LpqB family beta-propeller domain-containing protein [Gulosibacter sp.]|uniref:LpqB family beta-propeller domain-containing protein n=1 Tax=Gulosibacter sp. TaxID=2817531 RepID=UPI003F92C73C
MKPLRGSLVTMLAAVLVVVMTACAHIPFSGPVERGDQQEEESPQGIRYFPAGPTDGATREEIVQGFIEAGTGMQNDFSTARQYLTGEAAANWDPNGNVVVTEGQVSMKSETDDEVVVSVPAYGNVNASGVYEESISPNTQTLRFRLQNVDGEWRISQAPDGIILIQQAFTDLFEPRTLTFFDGAQQFTSPDLRWYPDDNQAATRAVEGLLGGPADWMLPGAAVTTAFPNGTGLLGPVRMNGAVAIVNFSDALSETSAGALSLIRLQLEQTLTSFPDITGVELQVNGARLDVALPSPEDVITSPQVNSSPLVQQDGTLGYLSGGSISPPEGADTVSAEVQRLEPIRGALSASRGTVALLTEDGTYAMRFEDEQATFIDGRGGQVEPALDNWDWVWSQSTTQPGLYLTRIGEYSTFQLALPTQIAPDFVSHQISRDGTRIVFLYEADGGVELAVSPIVRDENGTPTQIGDPIVLPVPGEQPNDVAWVDSSSVAMLVGSSEGTTDVRLYQVGGSFTTLGSIPSAMQAAGSNTLAGMRVVDRQGTLYAPRGTRWQASEVIITFLYAQV